MTVQDDFAACLDKIGAPIRYRLRRVRSWDRREELEAESWAHAWGAWVSAVRRGKDPSQWASKIGQYAVRSALRGRRFARRPGERGRCEREPLEVYPSDGFRNFFQAGCHWQGRVHLAALLADRPARGDRDPVFRLVAFRLDFAAWLNSLTEAQRGLVADILAGQRVPSLMACHRLSVQQLARARQDLGESWLAFTA